MLGLKSVGVVRVSYDQLPTARESIEGATALLLKAGLQRANIFNAPQDKTDCDVTSAKRVANLLNVRLQNPIWGSLTPNAIHRARELSLVSPAPIVLKKSVFDATLKN